MRYLIFLLLCFSATVGFAQDKASASDLKMSLRTYAKTCTELIDALPRLDYRDAEIVPITVNGETPASYSSGMDCDAPSLLPKEMLGCDGPCTPYSRLLMVRNDATAQIVVMFRRAIIRDVDSPLFDEIDMIMHSPANGATCWFQAKPQNPNCDPNIGADGRDLPHPNTQKGSRFWNSPQDVEKEKCGECHDNDPFYYSPYVAQVRNHLPADPIGFYSNAIGPFKQWAAPNSLEPRGNTCIGCHRIGTTFTCGQGLRESLGAFPHGSEQAKNWPYSHWMPVENPLTSAQWEERYSRAIAQLLKCCETPDAPDCNKQKILNQLRPAH